MKTKVAIIGTGTKLAEAAAAVLAQSKSFDGIKDKLAKCLQNVCNGRREMEDKPEGACDSWYCWVRDVFPNKVVYSCDGVLQQRDYKIGATGVTLGDPLTVEVAYKPMGESARSLVRESLSLAEAGASYDAKTGKFSMTVIRPGMSKNKRFYPAAVLTRDHKIFEGAKMFANHATDGEDRTRPEGDVNLWVANVTRTWAEADGTVKGEGVVIDPAFRLKLENLATAGLLTEMGTSIRAIGEASPAEVEDQKCTLVERFIRCRSVDFVTYAGAGGQVEALEADRSNDENDVDLLTVESLRGRRPDLLELVESNVREELDRMKTLEQQLQESADALKASVKRTTELETQITEATKTAAKATAHTELDRMLVAAKLPKVADDKLRAQFAEAATTDGMQLAIDGEIAYIKAIAATPKNMGPGAQVQEAEAEAGDAIKAASLVESFRSLGLSEAEAKIAAGGR